MIVRHGEMENKREKKTKKLTHTPLNKNTEIKMNKKPKKKNVSGERKTM